MKELIKSQVIGIPSTEAPVRMKNLKTLKNRELSKKCKRDKKMLLACVRKQLQIVKRKAPKYQSDYSLMSF